MLIQRIISHCSISRTNIFKSRTKKKKSDFWMRRISKLRLWDPLFIFLRFIYWKGSVPDMGEEKNLSSPTGSLPKWLRRSGLGHAKTTCQEELHPALHMNADPSTYDILSCNPRHLSRELGQKWSGWGTRRWATSLTGGSLPSQATIPQCQPNILS